ncbi:MAG: hypothetical protein N2050_10825 [Flavobacteriales bacterium]|nr:hypothetical protein [Flavobacteriales bacterium]
MILWYGYLKLHRAFKASFLPNFTRILVLFFLVSTHFSWVFSANSHPPGQEAPREVFAGFEPNKGQIFDQNGKDRPDVFYMGVARGFHVAIGPKGLSFFQVQFTPENRTARRPYEIPVQPSGKIQRVELEWLGARIHEDQIYARKIQAGTRNYYHVAKGRQPALGVPRYQEILISNIYNGVHLRMYSNQGQELETDWLLDKPSVAEDIRLYCRGAQPFVSESGELVLRTPLGDIVEAAPVAVQGTDPVACGWEVSGPVIRLKLGACRPEEPVVIDPPIRMWGTFFGGSGYESIFHSATDNQGHVIVAGYTLSVSQIATSGAFQTTFSGTSGGGPGALYAGGDAFVAKFSSDGQLRWATYIGGPADEEAFACAVNTQGQIYVVGHTASASGIATPGTHQDSLRGPEDMFVVKLDSSGLRLWGTYYGGHGKDIAWHCALDPAGQPFVVGETTSSNLISTLGAHQHLPGGNTDAVVARFSGNGSLLWGSYLGGTGNDMAYGCASDGLGNIYFVGRTNSTNNMVSFGAHQTSYGGGGDAFVAKFNATGSRLWSSYLGGAGPDIGYGVHYSGVLDRIVVSGYTHSATNISTSGTFNPTLSGADAFLNCFSASGNRLWGTYYGGSNEDYGLSCAFAPNGKILMAGYTNSNNGISTSDGFQTQYMGGYDAYLSIFDTTGQRLYGTYYGGMSDEYDVRVAVDATNRYFMNGQTGSAFDGTVSTPLSFQPYFGGGLFDGFLVHFLECGTLQAQASVSPASACVGATVQFTALPNGANAYQWSGPNNYISTAQNPIIPNIQSNQSGYYHVIIDFSNVCGDTLVDSILVTVLPAPAKPLGTDTTIYIGQQVTLIVQQPPGAQTYWYISPTGGSPVATGPVFLTPKLYQTTQYYVEFKLGACSSARDTVTVKVIDNTGLSDSESGGNGLLAFPLPAFGQVFLKIPADWPEASIHVYDLRGSLIRNLQVLHSGEASLVHLENLAPGVYILEARFQNKALRCRLPVWRP